MGLKDSLKRKKAISEDYFVPADDRQAEDLAKAERDHNIALFAGSEKEKAEALAKLESVRDRVREEGVCFRIVSVGRTRFEELTREHPPTEVQKAEHGDQLAFDPDKFWPKLLSESVNPGELSPEEWVDEVLNSADWGPGEIAAFRAKVMEVNTRTRVAELGN